MVETAARLVDLVLPRVPYRQWVLSVPKRVRCFLEHDPADPGRSQFHPATDLDATRIKAVANQMRRRGLRWLVRHEHLDADAAREMGEWRHDGGWSVDTRVQIPAWDRHGIERLIDLLAPPRKHRHRYHVALAPGARLRQAVTATAGPAGSAGTVAGSCSWRASTRIDRCNAPTAARQ